LSALEIATGRLDWHMRAPPPACGWDRPNGDAAVPTPVICSQAQPAALALIPGIVFSGSIDGHMRAFSSKDGKALWDFDTAQSFDAVNGFKATGGSISNGAQTIADGTLFINSGAAGLHQPGNALIALTVDGR
jgi:polyvinyl alcohol dehydrogenase (cytochrome)